MNDLQPTPDDRFSPDFGTAGRQARDPFAAR